MLGLALLTLSIGMQAPPAVEELHWLGGHWRALETGAPDRRGFVEELWLAPAAGAMHGINRSVRGGATRAFEYMRIVAEDGGLVFVAQPNGAPASRFPMVSRRPGEVVFANPAHDYPQRIAYRRDGDRLVATISLADGSRAMSWTFTRPSPR